jgi:hypothetical protein
MFILLNYPSLAKRWVIYLYLEFRTIYLLPFFEIFTPIEKDEKNTKNLVTNENFYSIIKCY